MSRKGQTPQRNLWFILWPFVQLAATKGVQKELTTRSTAAEATKQGNWEAATPYLALHTLTFLQHDDASTRTLYRAVPWTGRL